MKPKIRRKLAAFLAVCMTVSLMPELTWADTGGGGKTVVITEFKPLAEDIAGQEAPLGTRKSELNLPSKLKAVGYEQGAEDENDPPATDSSIKTGEDDTEPTPRALTVTGVKWEADEPYDETAAGETFTFTAVLPKRYVLEDAELPEIVVTLSEELKNNSKKATDSDVDLEEFAITKQPHDVYALVGHEVPFKVEATGGEITYRWQKGVPGPEADGTFDRDSAETNAFTWSDIDGADGAEYRFVAEEEDLTRNVYRCVLTCGEEELTTDAAKVKRMMMRANGNSVQLLDSSDVPKETYATLQAAIDAAKDGDTLKLLADIELGSTGVEIDGDRNLTLNLGKKKITYDGRDSAITLTGSASLTVIGGDAGKISATSNGGTAIWNTGTGIVSVEGGTVSVAEFNSYAIRNVGAGNVSVTGGTVSTTGDGGAAIYNAETGIVSVEGGAVSATGERAMAIRNYGKGRVSVEGGKVSAAGEEGIAIRNDGTGKITINGNARITSETTPDNGGTIYLSAVPGADADSKTVLEIQGGEVKNTAADGYAVYFVDGLGVTTDNVRDYYEQTDGTVTGKIYAEPVAVEVFDRSNTSKGIYTLQEAIDAAQDGDTLELLDDINLARGVTINGDRSLTLNLGEKKITYARTGGAIELTDSASLTVTGNTGKISTTGNNGTAIMNYGIGSVRVEGGTVSAVGGTAIWNYGTGKITIKENAKITSVTTRNDRGTICLSAVPANPEIVLEILGGTVENTAADGYAIYFKNGIGVTTDNVTAYCHVVSGAKVGRTYPALPIYTVTFEADGGSVSPGSAQTGTDGKLTGLPTPVRSNYRFDGWYTAAEGGVKITTDTVYTQDSTLYAHWTYTGDSGSTGNSGSGSGSTAGTTSKAPFTSTTTAAVEGGSVTTTTTTFTDNSGKKTTVTIQVTKDTAGNVTGSTTAVTTDNIQTAAGEGVSHVTVRPDGSAINSVAASVGATAQNPLRLQIEVPHTAAANELAKPEVQSVAVDVMIPNAAANNPNVEIGVTVGKETIQAAKDAGKNVTVTVRNENGTVEATWFLDGSAMKNTNSEITDVSLILHAAPGAIPATAGAATLYEIKRGDTLNKIAGEYGCTVQDLLNLNDIPDVEDLRIGQTVRLPVR